MLAKCANCQHLFQTDKYGQQPCPKCGATLMLPEPGKPLEPEGQPAVTPPPGGEVPVPQAGAVPPSQEGAAGAGGFGGGEGGAAGGPGFGAPPPGGGWGSVPPGGMPPGGGLPPYEAPQDQPTPWEERATRGVFPALVETIKRSLVDPVKFFDRMRVDNADGALSYYWINTAFGALVGYLWQAALAAVTARFGSSAGEENPLSALTGHGGPLFYVITGLVMAAIAPIGLYITAGIIHLGAMLFKSANRGFNATLRAVAYSSGPNVIQLIPFCGSIIAGIWTLVLIIIGLWKTQRTSVGASIGAVIVPTIVIGCCVCGVVGAIAALGGMAAASALGK